MEMLQRRPNVYMDICGNQYVRMGVVEWAVRAAGANRVLFGSDLTICDPATVVARVAFAGIDDDAKPRDFQPERAVAAGQAGCDVHLRRGFELRQVGGRCAGGHDAWLHVDC